MEYFNKTVETFPEREAVDDGVYCYGWRELHLLTQHIASAVAKKALQVGLYRSSWKKVPMRLPLFLELYRQDAFTSI